jgi:hypothetical protein
VYAARKASVDAQRKVLQAMMLIDKTHHGDDYETLHGRLPLRRALALWMRRGDESSEIDSTKGGSALDKPPRARLEIRGVSGAEPEKARPPAGRVSRAPLAGSSGLFEGLSMG